MSLEAAFDKHPSRLRDREVIRVDFDNDKLGIAAALRQAFCTAAHEPCARDFDKLLSKLN